LDLGEIISYCLHFNVFFFFKVLLSPEIPHALTVTTLPLASSPFLLKITWNYIYIYIYIYIGVQVLINNLYEAIYVSLRRESIFLACAAVLSPD